MKKVLKMLLWSAIVLLTVVFLFWGIPAASNAQPTDLSYHTTLTVPWRPFFKDVIKEGNAWRIKEGVSFNICAAEEEVDIEFSDIQGKRIGYASIGGGAIIFLGPGSVLLPKRGDVILRIGPYDPKKWGTK